MEEREPPAAAAMPEAGLCSQERMQATSIPRQYFAADAAEKNEDNRRHMSEKDLERMMVRGRQARVPRRR